MTYEFKLGKNPCPRCRRNGRDRKGDNFHWYGEGQGGSCFTCGYTIPSDAYKEQMGWTDSEDDNEKELPVTREALTEEQKAEVKELTGTRGMGYRGIRDETSRFFGVRYEYDAETGQPVAQYFPTTIDSELVGYRVRRFPKDFSHSIGKVGKETDMLAEFRFKTHSKTCVIVGGETKILTTYQMLKDDLDRKGKSDWEVPAVVASTLGEPGAHKQVQARYEFFSKFDRVLICMDNDEAGKEAAEKIAAVLPRGKAYIMSMRYKDSDEYIMDRNGNPVGKEHEFIRDYWNARPWTPDGVKSASDAFDGIKEELDRPRITLPK
jgi:Toprim-like